MNRPAAATFSAIILTLPIIASAEQFSARQVLRCATISTMLVNALSASGADTTDFVTIQKALLKKGTSLLTKEYGEAHPGPLVEAEVRQALTDQLKEIQSSVVAEARADSSRSSGSWLRENYEKCGPEVEWASANQ